MCYWPGCASELSQEEIGKIECNQTVTKHSNAQISESLWLEDKLYQEMAS